MSELPWLHPMSLAGPDVNPMVLTGTGVNPIGPEWSRCKSHEPGPGVNLMAQTVPGVNPIGQTGTGVNPIGLDWPRCKSIRPDWCRCINERLHVVPIEGSFLLSKEPFSALCF